MITLEINNSTSKISGLSIKQHRDLSKILSYKISPDQAYFSNSRYNPYRSLLAKNGEFPTGLLDYAEDYFLSKPEISWITKDYRIRPESSINSYNLKLDLDPYPDQNNAVEACLNAIDGRGIVSMPTGTGKSLVIAILISKLKVPILIVVPTLQIKIQLINDLARKFPGEYVGGLGNKIAVENIDALEKGKGMEMYQCIIIDEFHHSAAKTVRKLNKKHWGHIYYRFGFTATPWRTQSNEKLLLESILSTVIYELTYEDAVKKGYIVPVEAYYIDLPVQKGFKDVEWKTAYKKLVVENITRNVKIAELLRNLEDKSTLCLVKEIDHGHTLQDLIINVEFANGINPYTPNMVRDFNETRLKSLIGTVGVMGEGVDTKPCEYVIIAGLGKSKGQFLQNVGRAVRKYPGKESAKVIIFKDASNKYMLRHFKIQCKILEEYYGTKAVKL